MKTHDGRLIVVSGASRSGKTALTALEAGRAPRAFAWDPEDQWAQLRGWRRVSTRAELLRAAKHPGPQRIAYVAGGSLAAEFDFWAGCVLYAGRYCGPLVAIAEELADVTTPSKAPGNWGILLRRGLKRGITIYAISQRWAEADKTATGSASEFVLFRTGTATDAAYLASRTRVPQIEIDALKPLEFIRYDTTSGAIARARLSFTKAGAKIQARAAPGVVEVARAVSRSIKSA